MVKTRLKRTELSQKRDFIERVITHVAIGALTGLIFNINSSGSPEIFKMFFYFSSTSYCAAYKEGYELDEWSVNRLDAGKEANAVQVWEQVGKGRRVVSQGCAAVVWNFVGVAEGC